MTVKNYHHGDLRSALIEAGMALLEKREADDLSLREVARAVGVSATAVYRHFPDKGALMAALAGEGLTRLATSQRDAAAIAGGGNAGFSATGRAYVRFALANPGLFRLIFAHPMKQDLLCDEPSDVPDAMAMLRANAAASVGADGETARIVALQAWSLAHGLALLILDGQVEVDSDTIDAVVDTAALAPGATRA